MSNVLEECVLNRLEECLHHLQTHRANRLDDFSHEVHLKEVRYKFRHVTPLPRGRETSQIWRGDGSASSF